MAVARAICTCKRCGNTFLKKTTRYNRTAADEWEAWAEKHITTCPECEHKDYMAGAAKLAKDASAAGLPALQGSEKQIAWAEYVRADLVKSAEKSMAEFWEQVNALDDGEEKDRCIKVLRVFEQILIQVRNEKRAAWWIDHRDRNGLSVVRNIFMEQYNKKLEL